MDIAFTQTDIIFLLDLLGTVAFAISGVLTAIRKRMDLFGILIIAFVTAIGGGTLRDLLIDMPVAWLQNTIYINVILTSAILAILFRKKLSYVSKPLLLFDTLGLSIFTLIGLEKALNAGFPPLVCIATGTMTACFGGVIRDILANKIPIVFHRDIYATACILGGIAYFIMRLFPISNGVVFTITCAIIFTIRLLAVYYNWELPNIYKQNRK